VFATLCDLLDETDNRIVMMALDCIHDFFESGSHYLDEEGENLYIKALDRRIIDKIENLQDSPYEMIRKKTIFILENYFETE
jgi:uncharacterized protein (UPF0305 family)